MPTKSDRGMLRTLAGALAFVVGSAAWMPATAASLGNNFEISGTDCLFPDVAFGSVDSKYLAVWVDYNVLGIFGRLVSATGTASGAAFPISEALFGALYPAIAYNATSNEFLVTWDDAGDSMDRIPNSIVVTNGRSTFTALATNAATFYRLRRP